MKAAVCEAFGKPLVLSEVSAPSPGGAELLIRVSACGVCHSDLHLIDGEWRQWGTTPPFIPGHEVTGVVEEAGPEAGGFASAMGARVVAVLEEEERGDLVRQLGAREIIYSRTEKVGKRLSSMGGADLILLTAASARLFEQCIPGLGVNGTLVVLATVAESASLVPAALLQGLKTIRGSVTGTRDDMDAMLGFAADHGIAPVVERHPLESVNDVVGRLRAGKVVFRAVLVP